MINAAIYTPLSFKPVKVTSHNHFSFSIIMFNHDFKQLQFDKSRLKLYKDTGE